MFSILITALSLLSLSPAITAAPQSPSGVHIATFELTDESRLDPYAPPGQEGPRRLALTAFIPTSNCSEAIQYPVEYMPPATAAYYDQLYSSFGIPNGTFGSFQLNSCPAPRPDDGNPPKRRNRRCHPTLGLETYPLILFSPGLGISRLLYSYLLQHVASLGLASISIDHPYDGNIVEFEDGTVILAANISEPDDVPSALDIRSADLSFVLDTMLSAGSGSEWNERHEDTLSGLAPFFNITSPIILGHSLGGATAANTMILDGRFQGGINMDGSFFGRTLNTTLDRPFLLMGNEGRNQTSDPSWAAFWQHLEGPGVQVQVNGSQHGSFEDFPILIDMLGVNASIPQVIQMVGTVGAKMISSVIANATSAFEGFVSDGQVGGLLSNGLGSTVAVLNSTLEQ